MRTRRGVVAICQCLEYLRRELQPWPMEARDVSPVPTEEDYELLQFALVCMNDSNDVQAPTYLLRQMIKAEEEASGGFGLSGAGTESCGSTCELFFFFAISNSIRDDKGQRRVHWENSGLLPCTQTTLIYPFKLFGVKYVRYIVDTLWGSILDWEQDNNKAK